MTGTRNKVGNRLSSGRESLQLGKEREEYGKDSEDKEKRIPKEWGMPVVATPVQCLC